LVGSGIEFGRGVRAIGGRLGWGSTRHLVISLVPFNRNRWTHYEGWTARMGYWLI
jgi:hypothetical protein